VTRLVFKAAPEAAQPIWLCYGNKEVSAPRYDLSLVASEILRVEKSNAALGGEELAKGGRAARGEEATDRGGVIFWGVLAIVVAALLVLISRLLPKAEQQT
jgi:hypothetical protein